MRSWNTRQRTCPPRSRSWHCFLPTPRAACRPFVAGSEAPCVCTPCFQTSAATIGGFLRDAHEWCRRISTNACATIEPGAFIFTELKSQASSICSLLQELIIQDFSNKSDDVSSNSNHVFTKLGRKNSPYFRELCRVEAARFAAQFRWRNTSRALHFHLLPL